MDSTQRLERDIQASLIKQYEAQGYIVVKLILTNLTGIPDLLLLKDGKASFVEVKRPGQKPRPLQEYRIKQLQQFGFEVRVEDGQEQMKQLSHAHARKSTTRRQ